MAWTTLGAQLHALLVDFTNDDQPTPGKMLRRVRDTTEKGSSKQDTTRTPDLRLLSQKLQGNAGLGSSAQECRVGRLENLPAVFQGMGWGRGEGVNHSGGQELNELLPVPGLLCSSFHVLQN